MDRIDRALRLLEQVEYYADGELIIDPYDHDRFSCRELLDVADGRASMFGLMNGSSCIEATAAAERAMLDRWNANARRKGAAS